MSVPENDLVGRNIASIRVLEILAEGGMGRVYRGQDERLGREVAIKEIRPERRLDENAKARFRREAMILSRLEHPHICRVYELIETADRDYLVLELVKGRTLREVLNEDVDHQRALRIALQIAAALDAAHAISVVHRDLKPENIMIDGDGAVRVLDFGLARSTEDGEAAPGSAGSRGDAAEQQLVGAMTLTQELLGTPRYMSPEQARREAVTAASDLYSFGLILQELWTGQSPHAPDMDLPQLLQRVMWGEVDRPPRIAGGVGILVDELLNLDPSARPTAAEAVRRIQRMIDAPRRRVLRAAALSAAVSLVVAVVALGIGYWRVSNALELEAVAHQRSEAMREFLVAVLTSGDPAVRGPETRIKDVLADGAALIDERLAEHPSSWASAHQSIAISYLGLGLYDEAERHLRLAREKLLETPDRNPEELIMCTQGLASACLFAGRFDEAEELARRAHEEARAELHDDNAIRWITQKQLGLLLSRRAEYDEAEQLLLEASSKLEQLLGLADAHTLKAYESLSVVFARSGRVERAVELGRELAVRCERVLGVRHPDTLRVRANLASYLRQLGGHEEEAITILDAVIANGDEVLGVEHPSSLIRRYNLGVLYKKVGRFEEAESTLRQVLEVRRRVLGDDHPDVASTLSSLAPVLGRMGRFDEGEAMLRESISISETANGPGHPHTLNAMANLGNLLEAKGDLQQAADLFAEVYQRSAGSRGPLHPFTITMSCSQARVLAAAGQQRRALALLDAELAQLEGEAPDDSRVQQLLRTREEIESP